jgi:hypothetical protein
LSENSGKAPNTASVLYILSGGHKTPKEYFMKNTNVISLRLVGIIALVAVIGFSMIACGGDDDGNGNGGGGAGLTATSGKFKEDKIRINLSGPFTYDAHDTQGQGWTVKKNGTSLDTVLEIEDRNPSSYITIYLDGLSSTDTVTVSYDGTSGPFSGKIKAFTDLSVSYDSNL